jgi:predicted phage tail protein
MTDSHAGRTPVRVGTIVWGAVLLALAALSITITLFDPIEYSATFVLWVVVGFGSLLILGGIAGAIARSSRSRDTTELDGRLPE